MLPFPSLEPRDSFERVESLECGLLGLSSLPPISSLKSE